MKTTLKKWYPRVLAPVLVITLMGDHVFAQVPALEFASGAGPTGNGPSIAPQVIRFQNNTNNPTGNTFATYTPTTTVTFSLSNQQYAIPVAESATATSVMFGAGNTNATPAVTPYTYYNLMNAYSSSVNADYTSLSTTSITAGTGIDITKNYGLQVFTSAMGLYHAGLSTSGRYYMAELTITFNAYVTNPVLHVTGLGASFGSLGFTTELELQTPSVTLSRLSGSTELTVSGGTKILNNATTPGGTTGSGAASGSVLVTASNITSLTFKIFLRGNGGATTWSSGNHIGDGLLLGVSTPTALIVLPLNITNFTAASQATAVQLQWDSEIKDNSSSFNVESSRDGLTWKDIGKVTPTANGNAVRTYHFSDVNAVAGNNYYRIKEGDVQGDTVYSPVRSVYLGDNFHTSIFPNPVKDKLYITTNGGTIQSVDVADTDGKKMFHYNKISGNCLDMSGLPGGVYFVTISYAPGLTQTLKVLKE